MLGIGPIAGTDPRVEEMRSHAFGFRGLEIAQLEVHAIHETESVLVG
jgi:hypothetical protein